MSNSNKSHFDLIEPRQLLWYKIEKSIEEALKVNDCQIFGFGSEHMKFKHESGTFEIRIKQIKK